MILGDAPQIIVRHERDHRTRDARDIMVEPLEQEAVEIGEIAGDMQLLDLALAGRQILVAADDALDEQRAFMDRRAVTDEDLARPHLAHFAHRIAEDLLLLGADRIARAQLAREQCDAALDERCGLRLSRHPLPSCGAVSAAARSFRTEAACDRHPHPLSTPPASFRACTVPERDSDGCAHNMIPSARRTGFEAASCRRSRRRWDGAPARTCSWNRRTPGTGSSAPPRWAVRAVPSAPTCRNP